MFHLPHLSSAIEATVLFTFGAVSAGLATVANANHLNDVATICGSLATIFTVLAAILNGKNSRSFRGRKSGAITRRKNKSPDNGAT